MFNQALHRNRMRHTIILKHSFAHNTHIHTRTYIYIYIYIYI